MIRRGATLLALLALLGAPGTSGAPQNHYLRITAQAEFNLTLDYGSDPGAVYNGRYQQHLIYQSRAIVVFSGSADSVIPGVPMVVQGRATVIDERTEWVSAGSRKPVECNRHTVRTGSGDRSRFVVTSGGSLGVSAASGLRVDPGAAVPSVGCAATEELETHGLRGGPSFAVSAPRKSRFSGREAFSVACIDDYSHSLESRPRRPMQPPLLQRLRPGVRHTHAVPVVEARGRQAGAARQRWENRALSERRRKPKDCLR